jgi:hypothetical protein
LDVRQPAPHGDTGASTSGVEARELHREFEIGEMREFSELRQSLRMDRLGEITETALRRDFFDQNSDALRFGEYIAARTVSDHDLESLNAAIEYLRFLPGEKHVIYFHEAGLTLPRLFDEDGFAARASDARVRIHAFQTGGMAGTAMSLYHCRHLAELSGGFSASRANLRYKLQDMSKAASAVYLLGYVPKNQNLDGNLRRIKIEVARSGARVRHRLGYYAREVRPYTRQQLMALTRTAAALTYGQPITEIPMEAKVMGADISRQSSRFEIWVTVRPPESFFRLEDGRFRGKLTVTYVVLSPQGRPVWETWDDLDLALSYTDYLEVREEGIRLRRHLEVPARYGTCRVRIAVYDPESDKLASSELRVRLRRGPWLTPTR